MVPDELNSETIHQIIACPELLWDYLLGVFKKQKGLQEQSELVEGLPLGLKMYFYFTVFQGDITNGGIRQVFHNYSPFQIEQTIEVLEVIGAVESASLIRQAIPVYEEHTDWQRGSKERFHGPSWSDPDYDAEPVLNQIDTLYDDKMVARDYKLCIDYLSAHPEEFFHTSL